MTADEAGWIISGVLAIFGAIIFTIITRSRGNRS